MYKQVGVYVLQEELEELGKDTNNGGSQEYLCCGSQK